MGKELPLSTYTIPALNMKLTFLALALVATPLLSATRDADADRVRVLDGVVQPYRVVRVGAASDGLLSNVLVDRGDRVQRGQLLAELDQGVERVTAQLARARTELVGAIESARERKNLADLRLEKREKLVAEGLVTEDEVEEVRSEARLAELGLLQALESVQLAELEHRRSTAVLEQGSIESPIDGVIVERLLSPGELLSRSGSPEVVTVAQLDPLLVELHVPLQLFGTLAVGDETTVRFRGVDLGERKASVTVVDQLVDTASSTYRVRLELPNPDHRIPAGLRCEVILAK